MIKRIVCLVALALMAVGSGCQHHNLATNSCGSCPSGACQAGGCGGSGCMSGNCNGGGGQMLAGGQCPNGRCGLNGNGRPAHVGPAPAHDPNAGAGAPMSGTVAYPWYTTHGPRDFLHPNPPSIGR